MCSLRFNIYNVWGYWCLRPDMYSVWGPCDDQALMCTKCGDTVMTETWCVVWWHYEDWGLMCTLCGATMVIEAWSVLSVETFWWFRPDVYWVWGHCDDWGLMSTESWDTLMIEAWCVLSGGPLWWWRRRRWWCMSLSINPLNAKISNEKINWRWVTEMITICNLWMIATTMVCHFC